MQRKVEEVAAVAVAVVVVWLWVWVWVERKQKRSRNAAQKREMCLNVAAAARTLHARCTLHAASTLQWAEREPKLVSALFG